MAIFSRLMLSGSTNGRPIKVAATATPGTLIHTAVSGTSSMDEIYLYVANTSVTAVDLTIEFGGVVDPDDLLVKGYSVAGKSAPVAICACAALQNSLVVRAFASSANVLTITGMVIRIV